MDLTRRRVLIGLGVVAGAGVAIARTRIREARAAAHTPSITSGWRSSLVGIGEAYVRQHLAPSPDALRTGQVDDGLAQLAIERHAAQRLLASGGGHDFRKAVQDDFDGGRTTEVGGWILAVTEVAVALVAWGEESDQAGHAVS